MVEVLGQICPRNIGQRRSSLFPRLEVARVNRAIQLRERVCCVPLNEPGGGGRSAVAARESGHDPLWDS